MKKIFCVLITLLMISFAAVGSNASSITSYSLSDKTSSVSDAVNAYEKPIQTRRYYFQVPNGNNGPVAVDGKLKGMHYPTWLNSFSDADSDGELDFGPALFWYDMNDCPNPDSWVGYRVEKGDADNIYYADVPVNVTQFIWNNGIYSGIDVNADIYSASQMTCLIGCECYEPGENPYYPSGTDDFDNMICIINPDRESGIPEESGVYGVDWFYYYGDGHYGTCNTSSVSIEDKCINPDHVHARTESKCGDVDGDSCITVVDSTRIQQYLVNLNLSVFNTEAADVDKDKNVTVADATIIQQYLAKIPNRFRVGASTE